MKAKWRITSGGALAVGAASIAVAAAGAAVHPQSGHYRMPQPKDPNADVVSFELKGSKLYSFTHYDKCVRDVITGRFVTTVKGGKFEFHKTVKASAARYKVDLSGKFTSATKAKGTVTYKKTHGSPSGKAGCHTNTAFVVKKDGPARPPNQADR
jgi:hypothetical protein